MEFAHTGRVDLMPRTIIGVICAADHYEFKDLRDGGMQFFPMCLKIDTVCMLLMEMEKYRQYPVNSLLQEQVQIS